MKPPDFADFQECYPKIGEGLYRLRLQAGLPEKWHPTHICRQSAHIRETAFYLEIRYAETTISITAKEPQATLVRASDRKTCRDRANRSYVSLPRPSLNRQTCCQLLHRHLEHALARLEEYDLILTKPGMEEFFRRSIVSVIAVNSGKKIFPVFPNLNKLFDIIMLIRQMRVYIRLMR